MANRGEVRVVSQKTVSSDLDGGMLQDGYWGRVFKRMIRHRLAVIGSAVLLFLVLAAIFAPLVATHDPNRANARNIERPPSREHILGTDRIGRDVFSRLVFAARISLSVGLVAVSIYTTIGIVLGSVAGTLGGAADNLIMRLADLLLCFPFLPLVIVVVYILGSSIYNVMIVIGLLGWPTSCRLVRAELLKLRELDFAVAARAQGASMIRIAFRHLLPNALAPVIVAATFGVASAILLEAGLSFLGLGVQPPTASWGNMIMAAQNIVVISEMPWIWLPPGLAIFVSVLSINLVGDALRDALDPYLDR